MAPTLRAIADGVWQIPLTPRDGINAYLLEDVLVDAGIARSGPPLVAALSGRAISAHTITHAHLDHVGGSRHVVDALGVPMWAPTSDADAVESGVLPAPPGRFAAILAPLLRVGAVPVQRRLAEGDEVAGFTVLDVPGHSPGHIAFWRESDRVLVAGDVFNSMNLITTRRGLRPPPGLLNADTERNRRSMRRLAELEPALALFGHGPPVREAGPKLRAVVDGLG